MPRSQTLNENLSKLMSEDPATLTPAEARELYRVCVDDEGVRERGVAGDESLYAWLGRLRARGDAIDPDQPLPADFDPGMRRSILSQFEADVDHEVERQRKAELAELGHAQVAELNRTVQRLTSEGFGHDDALRIAQDGTAEVENALAVGPHAWERGWTPPTPDNAA